MHPSKHPHPLLRETVETWALNSYRFEFYSKYFLSYLIRTELFAIKIAEKSFMLKRVAVINVIL